MPRPDRLARSTRRALVASITALTVTLSAGLADAAPGITSTNINMRAGPDVSYPLVASLPQGTPVEIYGCLSGWNWCDTQAGAARGWVAGPGLAVLYDQAPEPLIGYGQTIGVPFVGFNFGNYWDNNYRKRPWFSHQDRWHDGGRYGGPGSGPVGWHDGGPGGGPDGWRDGGPRGGPDGWRDGGPGRFQGGPIHGGPDVGSGGPGGAFRGPGGLPLPGGQGGYRPQPGAGPDNRDGPRPGGGPGFNPGGPMTHGGDRPGGPPGNGGGPRSPGGGGDRGGPGGGRPGPGPGGGPQPN